MLRLGTRQANDRHCSLGTGSRGTYRPVYGIDAGEDGKIDIITEQCDFVFPQHGSSIQIDIELRTNYVVEIDQLQRGDLIGPAPAPLACRPRIPAIIRAGICPRHESTTSVSNLFETSKPPSMEASRPRVGSPSLYSRSNTENPNDLEPHLVTIGVNYRLDQPTDIYVVIDPDDEINSEITALNNVARND